MNRTTLNLILPAALIGLSPLASASPTLLSFGRETNYVQSGASAVALASDSEYPYRAQLNLQEDSSTSVFSAGTITTPSDRTDDLSWSADDEAWVAEYKVTSAYKSVLDSYCPTGTYTIVMTKVAGGTDTVTVALSSITTPDAPVIGDFSSLQAFDPTVDQTISWTAWSAGTSSDYITVKVCDEDGNDLYGSIDPPTTGALTGTATSFTIPANTLALNMTYTLKVRFIDILSTSTVTLNSTDVEAVAYAQSGTNETIHAKNLFTDLTHTYTGWLDPYDSVESSFGWICDSDFPWVYSVSADELANSGTYQGDGTGWIYIYPNGASLDGGFYLYRYASGSWAWTNYYWLGYVYDYTQAAWIDLTPASN